MKRRLGNVNCLRFLAVAALTALFLVPVVSASAAPARPAVQYRAWHADPVCDNPPGFQRYVGDHSYIEYFPAARGVDGMFIYHVLQKYEGSGTKAHWVDVKAVDNPRKSPRWWHPVAGRPYWDEEQVWFPGPEHGAGYYRTVESFYFHWYLPSSYWSHEVMSTHYCYVGS